MSLRTRITLLFAGLMVIIGITVIALVSRQFIVDWIAVPVAGMILWGVGFAVVGTGATWLALRDILRPLDTLAGTARELDVRQLSRRVELTSTATEFRALVGAVNGMLDRLAQGYDGQSRFAANASHELRTPLAVQRTLIEVAMDAPEATAELRQLGAQLLATNARNERLIDGMLVLAECEQGLRVTVPVRLDALAERVVDEHAELAGRHGLTLRHELAECQVRGDPVLLERLLANLIGNAIKYNLPDGWVSVRLARVPGDRTGLLLSVANTGPTVPAELVPTLLEPFRRMASERTGITGGAGLGLSIARSIVAAHDGALRVRPGDHGGLVVDVVLTGAPPTPVREQLLDRPREPAIAAD